MPNLVSGYAEMLKHSLLSNREMWARHLQFPLENPDFVALQDMVRESIAFKQSVVAQDPHEKGLRKSLNLGHTIGHALESVLLHKETPVLHGYAVAWGLLGELYLSVVQKDFPIEVFAFDHAICRRTLRTSQGFLQGLRSLVGTYAT